MEITQADCLSVVTLLMWRSHTQADSPWILYLRGGYILGRMSLCSHFAYVGVAYAGCLSVYCRSGVKGCEHLNLKYSCISYDLCLFTAMVTYPICHFVVNIFLFL